LFIDLFIRSLIMLIFISGSVVISFFVTRLLAYLIPFAVISDVFLWSGTVILSAVLLMGVAYSSVMFFSGQAQ